MSKDPVAVLKATFPKISGICYGVEKGYSRGSIFLGDVAEGGEIDGLPACNYYGWEEDPRERIWIMGVHFKLRDKLDELGYYAECHDPGTYIAYKQ